MIRSILVPLDGSTFGEHALPLAMSMARKLEAGPRPQLRLRHAIRFRYARCSRCD